MAQLKIAAVYVAARLVTTLFFIVADAMSTSLSRFGADPGIQSFVLGWDAQWYWWIAENGYPTELPLTDAGEVAENAWAFMPLYAYAAKIVGAPLGSWGAGALVVSLIAGYLACIALHRLLRDRVGSSSALWAVAFFAAGPLGALFQVGYAESLFLLLLFLALDAVIRRSYGWAYVLIPVMAFTRPGVLAFALFLGLHGIARWRNRAAESLPVRDIVHILCLGAIAVATGFSWQLIAAVATGDPGAYLATELAWRRNWIAGGTPEFVPFEGWIIAAQFWFEHLGLPGWAGLGALALLIAGAAVLLWRSSRIRELGVDLRLWSASYLVYLLAVFFPQSSTLRLLVPLSPLWGAVPRSRVWRWGLLVVCLGAQALWIHETYALGNTFWRVP